MQAEHKRLNVSAGFASVTVAIILVAIKLWAFGKTGSLSIAASLTDSAMDLIVSLTGLMAILYAARPADDEHAFGHASAEDLAALAQSILVTVSGCVIGWTAISRLVSDAPNTITAEGPGMIAMVASIGVTILLVIWQRLVTRKTGNKVVAADSLHYLSDLLPNVGAVAALAASAAFGIGYIDSVVAIAASLMLIFSAVRIGKSAFDALMDRQADPETIAKISAAVSAFPDVRGFHDLKTRTSGNQIFVQVHIELDGDQSLHAAHDIGAALRAKLLAEFPNADVIIHKDVYYP